MPSGLLLLLLEPLLEAVFHSRRESATLAPASGLTAIGTTGLALRGRATTRRLAGLALSSTPQEEDSGTEHDDEADQADDGKTARLDRKGDAGDEQDQPQNEQGHRLQSTTTRCRTHATASHSGGELGILGVESALDLVEHALLVLGEWHGTSPGTGVLATASRCGTVGNRLWRLPRFNNTSSSIPVPPTPRTSSRPTLRTP